jgi:hypothetical protein
MSDADFWQGFILALAIMFVFLVFVIGLMLAVQAVA